MLAMLFLTTALVTGGTQPDTTVRLPRGGSVDIDTRTRNVTVRTGSGDAVIVHGGTVEADGRELAISADDITGARTGTMDVTVPVWARVSLNTLSGNIVVEAAPERLEAQTFNGSIRVRGGTGTLDLESVAGVVTVSEFKGSRLSIDATGNEVTITNATGRIEVSGVSGAIRMHGIRSSHVEVSTVEGLIEFEGPLATDGHYEFESHSGGLTMILPADVSARLAISTFSGTFQSQIPATRSADSDAGDESDFTARLGRGEARVTIDSFSGNIRILRAGGH